MKPIRNVFSSLFVLGGIAGLLSLLHAQETTTSLDTQSVIPIDGTVLSLTPADIESFSSLSEAQLAALVGVLNATPTLPMSILPYGGQAGTFWSLQNPEWAPLPADLRGSTVWQLSNGSYLLNDLNVNYQAPLHSRTTSLATSSMSAMDSSDPLDPGDGSGTNTDYTPAGFTYTPPDYGTNLWIAQVSVAGGYLNAVASNTVADVSYEIQANGDLTTTNWVTTGLFFPGSETTNWTPFNLAQGNETNLFYRLRSWASSDGSGLPDWWELEYFGHTGVDPYGDPMGDGWSNLQKFQNGWNPNVFYTPPMPSGVNTSFNTANGQFVLSWSPSPGPVTNYLITLNDAVTGLITTYNVSPDVFNLTEDLSDDQTLEDENFIDDFGPSIALSATVTAQYAGGNSTVANTSYGLQPTLVVTAIRGPQGSLNLVVAGLPQDTTGIRVYRAQTNPGYWGYELFDEYSYDNQPETDPLINGYFEISATGITNGIYPVPTNQVSPFGGYHFWVRGERANGTNTAWSTDSVNSWTAYNEPFLDARQTLKDNLCFLLRAANEKNPFQFQEQIDSTYTRNNYFQWPTNYAYSSLFASGLTVNNGYPYNYLGFSPSRPVWENFECRNFVYDSRYIGLDGFLTDGVFYDYAGGQRQLNISTNPANLYAPTTLLGNATVPSSLLGQTETRWIVPMPDTENYPTNGGARNLYGLAYLSVISATSGGGTVYSPVTAVTNGFPYFETAQPDFQSAGYLFARPLADPSPELSGFTTTSTTPLMIQGVGTNQQYAGYAKLAVTNGYSGVYGYLGQYFDKACQIDTNGAVTANTTGVLSPYGDFFPTQPGPVALVTMPDIDPPYERGTCTVYAVSLQLDANHDGNMDLSFNGSDATSQAKPMVCWVNNGYIKPGSNGSLDQDLPVPPNDPANVNFSHGKITCQRDLENFFRLWICGLPAAVSNVNYSASLSCIPVSGSPAINLYYAETNGGTGYLADTNLAAGLAGESKLATISPSSPYFFPFFEYDGSNLHFLFEGAGVGEGQLVLTIYRDTQIIAQTSVWLDLHDIKDLYEQAHIDGLQTSYPAMVNSTNASTFVSDHELPANPEEASQLVVFVHGWRMGIFDYQSFSDSMFRRLYWAGYQGRFASLRWPTLSADDYRVLSDLQSYTTYNRSEYIAHRSADGTSAYFDWLKARLPNYSINAVSHSMGGIVMMETLKLQLAEGSHTIDNYVMMQAAVPAQCYDPGLPDYSLFTAAEATMPTPDIYRGYPGNIAAAVNGQIVNFFNTNDFALATGTEPLIGSVSWEHNEVSYKPDNYWFYTSDGTNCFIDVGLANYRLVTDPREEMAFVARPRSKAAGVLGGVAGQVHGGEVDLHGNFGFDRAANEHSAQFNWNIQQLGGTTGFYKSLLQKLFP